MISGIHLPSELKKAFEDLGFLEMTEIQRKTIPLIQQGRDVIAQSQTGSGKTAAFGFPILERITHNQGLQAMVLVPTRELCEQVTTEIKKFSKYKRMEIAAIYGGVSLNPQFGALRHANIVVGTPGRILDHMQRRTIDMSKIRMLVLDEADKMFEMGFIDDVKNIISHTPSERQTMIFSATISTQVHDIVRRYMRNPERVNAKAYVEESRMAQFFYSVSSRDKFSLLVHLLKSEPDGITIIFCATRNRVGVLSKNLSAQEIRSLALHGGMSQYKRNQSIEDFRQGGASVLVASDVAARGIDVKEVSHVINYDCPKTSKEYIHRIGRTARAGKAGKVISLISEADHDNFRSVLDDRSLSIEQLQLPQFISVPFIASMSRGPGQRRFGQGFGHKSYKPGAQRRGYGSQRSHPSGERAHQGDRRPHAGDRRRHARN